ncbi:hypothetical protein [Devosia sp. CAU 1758]
MKKILAALLALTLAAGIAAPAFAWDADNCPFTDKSMCDVSKSLLDTTDDD